MIGKSKIFHSSRSKKVFVIAFCLLCFFTFFHKNPAWSEEPSWREPFRASLTIQRTNCLPQEGLVDTVVLVFGFAENERALPVPPPAPGACIRAFFDPNETFFDGNMIESNRGFCEGWQETILPFPDKGPNDYWEDDWGIRITYPDSMPDSEETGTLLISWDTNDLISGVFRLDIEGERINMREESQVLVEGGENGAFIKITFSPYTYDIPLSVLGIVCVGGKENEAYCRGNFRAFSHLGDWTYKNLRSKIANPSENIRYLYYRPYHDLDGNGANDIFTDGLCPQKEALRRSIVEWVHQRWTEPGRRPKEAFLILYLVDHGTEGQLYLDPLAPNPNNQKVTRQELNGWLDDLEGRLTQDEIINYEIITVVEACFAASLFDIPQSENRIFIASADKEAVIGGHGRESFSHYFWEKIGKQGDFIKSAYDSVRVLFSDQGPFFWPDQDKFFIDGTWDGLPVVIPVIKAVEIDFESLDRFGYKARFSVRADRPIDRAWAAVVAPECSDPWCRFYSDPYECHADANNRLSFTPNYYFCVKDTQGYVYVRGKNPGTGEDTEISVPYYLDPNFLPDDLPSSNDKIPDDYEPDDTPQYIDMYSEVRIHTFHDPTDVDWIKFSAHPGATYDIELILHSPLSIDPNEIPFDVTIFADDEIGSLEFERICQDYMYEDVTIDNARTYLKTWKNKGDESRFIYLKIAPKREYHQFFLYRIHITHAEAEGEYWIFGRVNTRTREKIESGLLDIFLSNDPGQQFFPHWLSPSAIEEYYPCQLEHFYFKISTEYSTNANYSLWVGGEKRGTFKISDKNIIILPDEYFSDAEKGCDDYDDDCDGKTNIEEIRTGTHPNHPEIILHSGMNILRYPFWAISENGANLFTLLYDSNFIDTNRIDPDCIKICIFSNQGKTWNCYDSSSSAIFLKNKSGCLVYLDSNRRELVITLQDKPESDICLREVIETETGIDLYPGLNLVGLVGFQSFFDDLIPIEDGNFDSYSALHSLLKSLTPSGSLNPSAIMRYEHNRGRWEHTSPFFGRASGKRFKLQANEAYGIYMMGNEDAVWLPCQFMKRKQ